MQGLFVRRYWNILDSTRNFLRAALYLDNPVANDSIMPVIEYLKNDVNHILNTLVWDGR